MKIVGIKREEILDNMVFIGLGLAAVYWLVESFMYAMLADGVGFLQRLIGFDVSGILMRMPRAKKNIEQLSRVRKTASMRWISREISLFSMIRSVISLDTPEMK